MSWGRCGGHYVAKIISYKILFAIYYWPTFKMLISWFIDAHFTNYFVGRDRFPTMYLNLDIIEKPFT